MMNFVTAESMKTVGKLVLDGTIGVGGTIAAKIGTERLAEDVKKIVDKKKSTTEVEVTE